MSTGRRLPRPTGDPAIDEALAEFLGDLSPLDKRIALEAVGSVLGIATDGIPRLDLKIANSALKELRTAFKLYHSLRDRPKLTIFGSARTPAGHPEYEAAKELAHTMAQRGWMIVTGAGPGIMHAGHEGAEAEHAIGVNIVLPFEAEPNPVIASDPKLLNFRYFFTRKLMFVKESDAFVLLPGGFGTLDECFELLTLIQTGKSDMHPIVMLDTPGSDYWARFDRFIREVVADRGFIDSSDLHLYRVTDSIDDTVEEIERFYRVYHSERYVGGELVIRLRKEPSDALLDELSEEFADVLHGPIERCDPYPQEIRDEDALEFPRIVLSYDRARTGRLRRLIDRLNERV
jgi:uncharacterized protein (TIGR00730 family)